MTRSRWSRVSAGAIRVLIAMTEIDPRERVEQIIGYYIGKALSARPMQAAQLDLAIEHAAKAIVFEYDLEPTVWPMPRLH